MTALHVISGVAAVGLVIYLFAALIKAEKF
jgi:K+-transporting ATPase KdpF subunit